MLKLFILIMLLTVSLFANDRALQRISMQKESRVALIIGNNNYKSRSLSKLNNPINDARAIKKILSTRNFEIIYQEDATRKIMRKKLRLFYKKIRNGAVGFLYFSGHGLELDGENFLIPIDATIEEKDDVEDDSISVDSILKKMQKAGNRLNIAVLDACRNDPFSKGGSGGLAKVETEGIFVAYATSAGKVASDGRRGTNGLFTKHLIKYMKQDGLGLYDVFKKTRAGVFIESGKSQRPAIYDQVIGEEFFFTLPKNGTVTSVVAKPSKYSFKTKAPTHFSLTINTTPYNAKVYITNIKPKYYDGIKLKKGTYNIKVKRAGYLTKEGTIELTRSESINIVLEKEKVVYKAKPKPQKRYSSSKDVTVIDGLMWQDEKYTEAEEQAYWHYTYGKVQDWKGAINYCQKLTLAGYSDWRLPNKEALKKLYKKKLKNLVSSVYWSSSVVSWSEDAWNVYFSDGGMYNVTKSNYYYVRCVREGQ